MTDTANSVTADVEIRIVHVLLIEDNPSDALLVQKMLTREGRTSFAIETRGSLKDGLSRLELGNIDVILLDLTLPDSQGLETFFTLNQQIKEVPIIVFSSIGYEEISVDAVRKGAQDYLVKGEITVNILVRAIRYAIERKQIQGEREGLILELEKALDDVKLLTGMLPICANCKKIRDKEKQNSWIALEAYIRDHSEADFSHSICPECAKALYHDSLKKLVG